MKLAEQTIVNVDHEQEDELYFVTVPTHSMEDVREIRLKIVLPENNVRGLCPTVGFFKLGNYLLIFARGGLNTGL